MGAPVGALRAEVDATLDQQLAHPQTVSCSRIAAGL
jgi:hypothetical protein